MLVVRHSNSPYSKCSTENFGKHYVILSFSSLLYIYIIEYCIMREGVPFSLKSLEYIISEKKRNYYL